MRKESKYILGTIAEVANELYKIDEKKFTDRFVECDFALANDFALDLEKDDLETIYIDSTGWYGIKKIDPGFDSRHDDNVDLFADYYGGGCGTYELIGDWEWADNIVKTIKEMIINVLSYQEGTITENDVIICGVKRIKKKVRNDYEPEININ